ncbi:MAG: hypothetical protein IKP88_08325 [Lachnospiraceae bacterium]|nr:hypothetical protein [Lachnospiraceae bacterium]
MNKSKIKSIFAIIIVAICMVYFFIDILDLFNTEDRHTVSVVYAYEALEVNHKLFYIIPTGTDHYFLAYDEDNEGNINGYVVKASLDWYNKNFSSGTGFALDLQGVEIDSLSKSYRAKWYYEIEDAAYKFQNLLLDNGTETYVTYPYGLDHCFVLDYKSTAIEKIILFVMSLALIIFGIIAFKHKETIKPVILKVFGILVVADVICFLILLFKSM